jgi:hypothetical protein
MQLHQHQTLPPYLDQSSHERTVDPPCARTRNIHDSSSTTCSQPQRAAARSPRILAQKASRAAHQRSRWYPNLACMANHARGADVCNGFLGKQGEQAIATVPPRYLPALVCIQRASLGAVCSPIMLRQSRDGKQSYICFAVASMVASSAEGLAATVHSAPGCW